MERVTPNPSRAAIEERIARVVREHADADRRFRQTAERLNAAFWAFTGAFFASVAIFFLAIALRG
jgi:hypothetical protein